MEKKLHLIERCPDCGSVNFVEDPSTGETICSACGLVIREKIMSEGPEWRAFTQEEKEERSRVGTPVSLSIHDKGLSTVIDKVNRDAFGRELPLSTKVQMLRLKKWQIRAKVYASMDRNLAQAMSELDRLADKIGIPSHVKEKAALIYRKALDKRLVRGRSIAAIVAASLYAACRLTDTPRTLKEIAKVSLVKRRDISRCYRLLVNELDLKMPLTDPRSYISKIGSKIGVSEQIKQLAMEILEKAIELKINTGKDPTGIAAAALYIACVLKEERKTQKEIADAAGVTEVTVRNRYKNLKAYLDKLLPKLQAKTLP